MWVPAQRRRSPPKLPDRLEKPLSMSKRNTELLEIGLGQFRKDLEIDRVVAKERLVLSEAHFVKPGPDFHGAPRKMKL